MANDETLIIKVSSDLKQQIKMICVQDKKSMKEYITELVEKDMKVRAK